MREPLSPPVLLHVGRELHKWIIAGGRPERFARLMRSRLRWGAYWFERHAAMTARRCTAASIPLDPIFIVGMWRTGSTALHQSLTQVSGWTTPLTWQCFRPADFLLVKPPQLRRVTRPMDHLQIDTRSAQEDEFAALVLGEPSLYRAFIDPRRLPELTDLLQQWQIPGQFGVPQLSDRWETFLKAILQERSGRLLLKSPGHTFRVPWLAARFPGARFIWLTRSAGEILSSNHRMWSAMIDRYGLWRCPAGFLEAFLSAALRVHDEIFDWARVALKGRIEVLTFQEVIRDPTQLAATLFERICAADVSSSLGNLNEIGDLTVE
jgi:hypothetical protein